jgi:hypothetical protein
LPEEPTVDLRNQIQKRAADVAPKGVTIVVTIPDTRGVGGSFIRAHLEECLRQTIGLAGTVELQG